MNEITEEILNTIEKLEKKINDNLKIIDVSSIIDKKGIYENRYFILFSVHDIIKSSVQCGNYKRALRYIYFEKSLLDGLEKDKYKINEIFTDMILK
jgi:hypothetical protein